MRAERVATVEGASVCGGVARVRELGEGERSDVARPVGVHTAHPDAPPNPLQVQQSHQAVGLVKEARFGLQGWRAAAAWVHDGDRGRGWGWGWGRRRGLRLRLGLQDTPQLLFVIQRFELQLVEGVFLALKVGQVEAVGGGAVGLAGGIGGAHAGRRQRREDVIVPQPRQHGVQRRRRWLVLLRGAGSLATGQCGVGVLRGSNLGLLLRLGVGCHCLCCLRLRSAGTGKLLPPAYRPPLQSEVILKRRDRDTGNSISLQALNLSKDR